MKRFFQSGIGAAVAWVLSSLVLAAVISPWVYQGGKQFAAWTAAQDLPALLEWLGAACGRAKFGRFFDRSVLISALLLLPLMLRRIRRLKCVPENGVVNSSTRVGWQSAATRILIACAIGGSLLWCMGAFLETAGAFSLKTNPPSFGKLVQRVVIPAVAVSLMEEWLFRGVLLGLWLRSARPAAACLGTSALFAFLHFLKPPPGTLIADPASAFAGFELLGKILLHFTDPLFFVTDFASLMLAGLVLAWARIRTGTLWFSIGLHAGWILALKGFNFFYQKVMDSPLRPWVVGESLRSGIAPLLTLAITAVICHFALRALAKPRPSID